MNHLPIVKFQNNNNNCLLYSAAKNYVSYEQNSNNFCMNTEWLDA